MLELPYLAQFLDKLPLDYLQNLLNVLLQFCTI